MLGLAATLDKYGQQAETSSTAIGQAIMAMFKRTETFANIAGMSLKDFSDILNKDVNEAFLRVLEGMQSDGGGLSSVVSAMEEMHLNGQRAATVLGTLSKNTEELRNQQELAKSAFMDGTSIIDEFNTKNTSLTASLEKHKKAILEQTVAIGQQLLPVSELAMSASQTALSILSRLVKLGVEYKAVIIGLTAATAVYVTSQKLKAFWSKENRVAMAAEVATMTEAKAGTLLLAAVQNLLAGNLVAAKVAMQLFNKALLANPVGLVLGAFTALAGVFMHITSEARKGRKAQKEFNDSVAEASKIPIAKIEALSSAYKQLGDDMAAKEKFIRDNASAFEDLGVAVKSVKDAEDLLINNKQAFIDAQIAKATAAAYQKQAEDKIAEIVKLKQERESMPETVNVAVGGGIGGASNFVETENPAIAKIEAKIAKLKKELEGIYKKAEKAGQTGDEGTYGVWLNGEHGGKTSGNAEVGTSGNADVGSNLSTSGSGGSEGKTSLTDYIRKTTQDEIAAENERFAALQSKYKDDAATLEALEREHNARLAQIRLKDIEAAQADAQREYNIKKAALQNRQNMELSQFKGSDDELQALKRKQAEEMAAIDLEYTTKLSNILNQVVDVDMAVADTTGNTADSVREDFSGIADKDLDDIVLKLHQIVKLRQEAFAKMNMLPELDAITETTSAGLNMSSKGAGNSSTSGKLTGTGGGSVLGADRDTWTGLFNGSISGLDAVSGWASIAEGTAEEAFNIISKYSDKQTALEQEQLKDYEEANDKKKTALEKRLNSGLMTEAQYNAEVEAMDAEYDAYSEEIALKQAKREKAQNLAEAIINTALSATKALAQFGMPLGPIMAATVAALGAVQVAAIASTPVTSGYAEGGYVLTKREQDGKTYNARLSPDKRGFISSPTILVGENGGEYVIPADGLDNPTLAPILATMETARRNGSLKNIDFRAAYPVSAYGRADGGYTAEEQTASAATSGIVYDDSELKALLSKLSRQLDSPIEASVRMTGRGGLEDIMNRREQQKKRSLL